MHGSRQRRPGGDIQPDLARRPDPHDQRGKRIVVTRRGTRAIRVIRDAVSEIETTWTQQLGAEHFAQLKELLLKLNQLT